MLDGGVIETVQTSACSTALWIKRFFLPFAMSLSKYIPVFPKLCFATSWGGVKKLEKTEKKKLIQFLFFIF
jgi:hypothetical protein